MLHSVSGWISKAIFRFLFPQYSSTGRRFFAGGSIAINTGHWTWFATSEDITLLVISGMHLNIIIGSMSFLLDTYRHRKSLFVRDIDTLLHSCTWVLSVFSFGSSSRNNAYHHFPLLFVWQRTGFRYRTVYFVFLICLFSPFAVFDVGLQLSFLSCLGILSLGNGLCRKIQTNRDSHIELSVYVE